jgi:RNA polymerase sigma factor (sigma-70 family)
MTASPINRVVGRLRHAALRQTIEHRTDAQLLEGFISRRESAAFEALVRRHGAMVLGVCRRVLGNDADADDAFQATFLVLVRKAASVVPRERVGNWLYGVAVRTAMKARAMSGKRRARERQAAERPRAQPGPADNDQDLQAVLDAELERLPEKYRAAIVLCDLEGKTHREAARVLGWPDGTLSTRLVAARRLLAQRLTRRGVAMSAGAPTALLTPSAAQAGVPVSLLVSTVQAAAAVAAGQAAAGAFPAKVAALAEGVLKAMLIAKLKTTAALLLGLALFGGITGGLTHHGQVGGVGLAAADPARPDDPAGQAPDGGAKAPGLHGTVIRIDQHDNLLEISVGSGDGVKEGQVLHVYRTAPKAMYLGQAKVLAARSRTAVVRPLGPNTAARISAGDHVTDAMPGAAKPDPGPADPAVGPDRPKSDPADGPNRPKPDVPSVPVQGVVKEVSPDRILISIDADAGVQVGQILEVYRLKPKAMYLGQVKVIDVADHFHVAKPVDADMKIPIRVNDLVTSKVVQGVAGPNKAGDEKAPAGPAVPLNAGPTLDVRHTAELFLIAAVAGRSDAARTLASPNLPKRVFDEAKGLTKQVPPLALVRESGAEAIAISEPFEVLTDKKFNKARFVVVLKRAEPVAEGSAWFAGNWFVAGVDTCDADETLTKLIDFLHRYPDTRHAPNLKKGN